MAKPAGASCNLNCTYCYYLEKENLYQKKGNQKMSYEVLEEFIKQYIASQPTPIVSFIWQGGEPCLMGLEFYQKAVSLQQKYADGKQLENSFQTNGTLLDDAWCHFFKEHNFLVGISIDGPEELHDRFRKNKAGQSSFSSVMQAIEKLKKFGIEFNTLTTVNRHNGEYPLEVYRFLKSIGSRFMQFIPVVERISENTQPNGLKLVPNTFADSAQVTSWSVGALQFGQFMSQIFDEWVKQDVGSYFIQLFDSTLANWVGEPPGVCLYAPACGHAGTIEHNGDIFSCDHFVFPDFKLGNILQTPLTTLMNSTTQQLFGQNKYSQLPDKCRKCNYLNLCNGECPKKRFLTTEDDEPGLNYLCEGYQHFFAHVSSAMEFMANELKNERSPANVMTQIL